MNRALKDWEGTQEEMTAILYDMFLEIDINGDGNMQWDVCHHLYISTYSN